MTYGQHINQARLNANMTLQQLADKSYVSINTLICWIYRGVHPDLELLILVADALNVSLDELVGRKRSE